MSAMTDAMENLLVDHVFRARQWTAPTAIKVKLFTAAPGEAGGGTEVTGGGYVPVSITTSDTAFNATQGGTPASASSGSSGLTENAAVITFPTPTANWGQITHHREDNQADLALLYGALTVAKTVNNGDPAPTFAAGALDITFA